MMYILPMVFIFLSERFYGHVQLYFTYECVFYYVLGQRWPNKRSEIVVRHLGREPDFWAGNRIFKNFFKSLKKCLVIGFNHGVLGLAENPARGTGFWSQNTEGVARGVLTEKARPEGWVCSQAQHPMIKTYYSMFLHCNATSIVFKLLAIVKWKRQRADISSRHCC